MSPPPPPPDAAPAAPAVRSRLVERSPGFYGWWVLGAATLGLVATLPGQTVGVSIFLDPILADLGLPRATVSLLYTLGTLAGSFALPFVGRFIDRRGPRLAVTLIAAAFALACGWMAGVQGLVGLLIGFVLIRGLGQGSLSLVSLHVVNLWFVRRRGLAVALTGLGFAGASAVLPLGIEALIGVFGWRGAYAALGVLVALTILPVGALVYRGHPERFGQTPDGRAPRDAGAKTAAPEPTASAAQARRSLAFWVFAAGDVAVAALSTGLVFHHYDLVVSQGMTRLAAASVFVPLGIVTAAANLTTGVLFDRVAPRFLLAVALAFQAAALALAGFLSTPLLVVYGAVLGLGMGMRGALSGAVYAHLFGRAHLGSIKGFATTLTVAGTAAGPLLFALGRDLTQGYAPVLLVSALVPLAIAATALLRPGIDRPLSRPPEGPT